MKEILNDLYQHKKLSKSEAKQVLIDIAASAYNDAHLASFMTVFNLLRLLQKRMMVLLVLAMMLFV